MPNLTDFMINLDANATYGLLPEVAEGLYATLKELVSGSLLNPSSIHQGGQRARLVLEDARDAIREASGVSGEFEVVFTSGATEGNNWILQNIGRSCTALACSAFEHASVIETMRAMSSDHRRLNIFGLDREGQFDPAGIVASLPDDLQLLSCMVANNETGEVFPVCELFREARKRWPDVFLHTDAVQVMGKLALNLGDLGADAITISGHKFGSVSGVGAVLLNTHRTIPSFLLGGPQEGRYRGGTENIIGIKSMGIAARIARRDLSERIVAMKERVGLIEATISKEIPELKRVRAGSECLPNTLCIRVPGVRSDDLVVSADLGGLAISAGAACSSGKQLPSHVLLAAGLSEDEAKECIRLSVCGETPIDIVLNAATTLASIIGRRIKR